MCLLNTGLFYNVGTKFRDSTWVRLVLTRVSLYVYFILIAQITCEHNYCAPISRVATFNCEIYMNETLEIVFDPTSKHRDDSKIRHGPEYF